MRGPFYWNFFSKNIDIVFCYIVGLRISCFMCFFIPSIKSCACGFSFIGQRLSFYVYRSNLYGLNLFTNLSSILLGGRTHCCCLLLYGLVLSTIYSQIWLNYILLVLTKFNCYISVTTFDFLASLTIMVQSYSDNRSSLAFIWVILTAYVVWDMKEKLYRFIIVIKECDW